MYYVLLIHADESGMGAMAAGKIESITKAVDQFDEELTKAGQNIGSLHLQPSMTGTTVRVRDGKTLTTDGPFIETKEQLGGIYLVEATDLDEALGIASRLPTAAFCTIEVRPLQGVDLRRTLQAW